MNKRIKLVTYYGDKDEDCPRSNSPAADTKTDYIIDVLNRCGYAVDLISHSSISKPGFYYRGKIKKIGNNTFRYFGCFGKAKYKVLNVLNWLFMDANFFIWCLININKREQIIVYHSLGYDATFIRLKRLKKVRIVGEIEEIYQDVFKQKKRQERNEYKFIEICDKYIFPNTILNERINKSHRQFLVVHGVYAGKHRILPQKDDDGRINILYAGIYDPYKGGAIASVRASEYLDERFHLHICGFGSVDQEENLISEINSIQNRTKCKISFHGFLNDQDFLKLMQGCTIGLCTQDPTNLLNHTSFPSKILNYMANGLVVVSGRSRAVAESAVGAAVFYYDKQEPEAIAKAIIQCSEAKDSVDSYSLLNELDNKFVRELATLLHQETSIN